METFDDDIRPFDIMIPVSASADTMFARLGVEFASFADGDTMRRARLPENWKIERVNKISKVIIDDTGAKRAELVIEGVRRVTLHILPRYSIGIDKSIVDANVRARFCVWDQKKPSEDKAIFEVSYPVPNVMRNRNAHERTIKHHADKEECRKWLNAHYPEWENPVAYWDEEYKDE
jgi:hypothetical protein